MEQTAFFVIGIALVVIALVVSVIGLRYERFPGSRLALAAGAGLLVVMVAATTTTAVINAREEQKEHNEEAAAEEEQTETEATEAGESPEELEQQGAAEAGAGNLELSAPEDGTLAFDTDALEAEAGEVTVGFDNPASIEHDVAIEGDGEEIAKSDLVSEGTTEVTADLDPGEYAFYCSVPGHREGGMEGTLTVR
ncbi:MAG TPA: plastocyanin/azurin family copper-binding protein [Solirubrobacterales bacterium]|jgi:plastocyanin|nr:plastocyanin/azurin family copper-binding protein [Solirubrobacterales bacterium]